jgi:hypothetical protein
MNYKYRDQHSKRVLTVEQVDKLIELSIIAPKSKFDAIIKGVQLVLVGVACWAKKSMMEEEQIRLKQQYEREIATDNQMEVDEGII